MSALVDRSHRSLGDEFERLEFSDQVEISPASIWAVEYEDEITLQTKRVAVSDLEQVTTVRIDESSAREAAQRGRVLDERAVLPSEASFATVGLNQPVEPTTVKRREHSTGSNIQRASASKAVPRSRILDESAVLPGEESFSTVMLNHRTNAPTYSPLAEFLVKFNLNWRRLNLAMLLLLSILAVITVVILTITRQGVFNSHPAANTPAETLLRPTETATAPTELATPGSSEAATTSGEKKEVSAPVTSTAVAKLEATIAEQKELSTNSEPLPKVAADDTKLSVARKGLRQETKSVASRVASGSESGNRRASAPQRQASMKEMRKRATAPEKVHVNHPQSEIVGSRAEAPFPRDEVGRPKNESKSAPATGGGQRPRRVTP